MVLVSRILHKTTGKVDRDLLRLFERCVVRGHILDEREGSNLRKKFYLLRKFRLKYLGWIFVKLRLMISGNLNGKTFWGKSLMLPRQDKDAYLLGTSGFLGGANEVALTKFLLKNLRGEDIFYDIGANFGFYTYLAHELISPEGSVHAFEPAPFVFSYLKKNCLGSANIFLNEIALFDQQTTKDFYDTSDTKHSGRATLIKEMLEEGLSFRKRAVKTTTLDRYLQNHPAPSFMKIDTEGSEYQILKGGESFLRHCSPIIVLEVWGGDKGRLSLRAVEILRELQFRAFLLKDNGDLEKFSLEQLKEFISKGKIRNFIFKK